MFVSMFNNLASSKSLYGNGRDGNVSIGGSVNLATSSLVGRSQPDCFCTQVTAIGEKDVSVASLPAGALKGGDEVMIHLTQAPSSNFLVGQYELFRVSGIQGTTIKLSHKFKKVFGNGSNSSISGAFIQLVRVPNYKNIDPGSALSISGKAWDGASGGIIAFRAFKATSQVSVSAFAMGFPAQGGGQHGVSIYGYASIGAGLKGGSACGGGGHAFSGGNGRGGNDNGTGAGGSAYGVPDLSLLNFGSSAASTSGLGGTGGGIIFAAIRQNFATNFSAGGNNGGNTFIDVTPGGGSGGSVKLFFDTTVAVTGVSACGGTGGSYSPGDVGLGNSPGPGSCTGAGGGGGRQGPNIFGNFCGNGGGGSCGRTWVYARVYNNGPIPTGPAAVSAGTPAYGSATYRSDEF